MASNEPLKWYDPEADNPPWIKALADVRHMACREGWCYHHVQAIIVSIDSPFCALLSLPPWRRARMMCSSA